MSHSQTSRAELTAAIIDAKDRQNLSWQDLADATTLSVAFVTAALLGQHRLPADAAASITEKLNLGEDAARVLQTIPTRGCIPDKVPTSNSTSKRSMTQPAALAPSSP
jgi:cyanate lyase